MKNDKIVNHRGSIIAQLLSEITPIEEAQVSNKMLIAAHLEDLMIERGWNKSEFAQKVNKKPSEITKWLSGTHNFTIDILTEICVTFNKSLGEIFSQKQVPTVVKFHFSIEVRHVQQNIHYVTPMGLSPNLYSKSAMLYGGDTNKLTTQENKKLVWQK